MKRQMIRPSLIALLLIASGLACNLPAAVPTGTSETSPSVEGPPEERPISTGDSEQDPLAIQFTCEQPQMDTFALGALNAPDDAPVLKSLAFLELPFPYDGGKESFGGTDFQFRQVSQRRGAGGRINSFFDHLQPLYPSPLGREPKESPIGDHILIFDGILSDSDWYSGHPAYDYSTFTYGDRSTPVFAAADGVIDFVGKTYAGALTVKINHTVEGVGEFQTIYMHLHPDRHFEAMTAGVGFSVTAGTRIGTMGNTGYSTGPHLHFEVRFDANGDGLFTLNEVIDPYGFVPSNAYPSDPWGLKFVAIDESTSTADEPSGSPYLWIHPLTAAASVPDVGGGKMELQIGLSDEGKPATLCAQAGSVPPGGSVIWTWSPSPLPTDLLAGTGDSFVVTVIDEDGRPVPAIDPPFDFHIPIDSDLLADVDRSTLGVYWLDPVGGLWFPQPTEFNSVGDLARVSVDRPGRFALLGLPTRDLVPPDIEVQVSGQRSDEGVLYHTAELTLSSTDPSGVTSLEYSLDGGQSWQEYSEPFTLERTGIPEGVPANEEPEEVFGGRPGHFVVLVSAVDGAGNRVDPPIVHRFIIDPAVNPDPTVTALVNLNCRLGPGTTYDVVGFLLKGQTVELDGRNASNSWWWIQRVDGPGHCWVSDLYGVVSGDPSILSIIAAPVTATPTATVTPTPTPTPTQVPPPPLKPPAAPTDLAISACVTPITLTWTDNADNESGYRVFRDGQTIATLPANSTGYVDDQTPGATYEVEAFNLAGNSARASVNWCVIG